MRFYSKVILFALSLTTTSTGLAQSNYESYKAFSPLTIFFGPSLIGLRDYQSLSPDLRRVGAVGYSLGVASNLHLTNRFQLSVKLMYEKKGGKFVDAVVNPKTNVLAKNGIESNDIYTCITLPACIRYSFGERIRFWFESGPYLSYSLKATEIQTSKVANAIIIYDLSDIVNKMDYGLCAGFGCSIPVNKLGELSVAIVGLWGFQNILNGNGTWKTTSLGLQFGLPLPRFNK